MGITSDNQKRINKEFRGKHPHYQNKYWKDNPKKKQINQIKNNIKYHERRIVVFKEELKRLE